jgi:nicotinate-nucleotide adenylyltransferase
MRLGLLGGTFNPIHRGHLALASAARDGSRLDRVVLIPSARPPHKRLDGADLAPAEDRLAMARLAAQGEPGLEVSDLELRRSGPSFTIDTIAAFERDRPDAELFFIIGADSLGELESWRDAGKLLDRVRFVVVNRPGHDVERGLGAVEHALGAARAQGLRERTVTMEPVSVSATQIRDKVRRGEPIDGLVPDRVRDYIAAHGLYRAPAERRGRTA